MQFKKLVNPLTILFLLGTSCLFLQAQNLVINPSFEDYDTCIQTFIPYGYPIVNNWKNASVGTPGYYNYCSTNPNFRPIGNNVGNQTPRSGSGFSGIFVYSSNPNIVEKLCSDFIQVELTSSLLKDSLYCVKFFVSQCDYLKLSIDKIGVFLSNTQIISSTPCFPYLASLESDNGYFLNDISGWMLCKGIYKAKGGEQFITIGNFNSFANTNSVLSGTPNGDFRDSISSYYIDDVSVEMLPSYIALLSLGRDSILCDTAGFTKTLSVSQVYDSVRWNTGATTFNIQVSTIGTYSVTAYYGECAVKDTIVFSLFNLGIQFTSISDTAVCEVNTPVRFSVANGFDTYLWSIGDTSNYTDITPSGTYSVMTSNRCFTFTDTFTLTVFLTPAPPFVTDTTLCEGSPEIPATALGENLNWYGNNSDTSLLAVIPFIKTNTISQQQFFVSQNISGCESDKAVFAASITALPKIDLGSNRVACRGKILMLQTKYYPDEQYLWSSGDTSNSISITDEGTYYCTVTNACGSVEDEVIVQFVDCDNCSYVPNVFSPNNDGSNDFFQVYSNCPLLNFRLKMFNRWGEKVFESQLVNFVWDGNFKGQMQESGIYTYTLSLTNELGQTSSTKGSVTLVR